MKASEFYEKYWKIDNGDGTFSNPKPLTEKEKKNLDEWTTSGVNVCRMQIKRKPSGEVIDIDIEAMEKKMEQLDQEKRFE